MEQTEHWVYRWDERDECKQIGDSIVLCFNRMPSLTLKDLFTYFKLMFKLQAQRIRIYANFCFWSHESFILFNLWLKTLQNSVYLKFQEREKKKKWQSFQWNVPENFKYHEKNAFTMPLFQKMFHFYPRQMPLNVNISMAKKNQMKLSAKKTPQKRLK